MINWSTLGPKEKLYWAWVIEKSLIMFSKDRREYTVPCDAYLAYMGDPSGSQRIAYSELVAYLYQESLKFDKDDDGYPMFTYALPNGKNTLVLFDFSKKEKQFSLLNPWVKPKK